MNHKNEKVIPYNYIQNLKTGFGVDVDYLQANYGLRKDTIARYKPQTELANSSSVAASLVLLFESLNYAKNSGWSQPLDLINSLNLRGMSFRDFLASESQNPLAVELIKEKLRNKTLEYKLIKNEDRKDSATKKYNDLYGPLVYDEDLERFSREHPDDLVKIIKEGEEKPYRLAYALIALSEGARLEYFDVIKEYCIDQDRPYLRSGAFQALKNYWNEDKDLDKDILNIVKEALENEKLIPIKEELKQLKEFFVENSY